jgi:hypothetical protein
LLGLRRGADLIQAGGGSAALVDQLGSGLQDSSSGAATLLGT